MKSLKYALGVALLAGSALGMTLVSAQPAEARVAVGIGLGFPGYYGGYYDDYGSPCMSARFRYYHPEYCGYGGYYGPGYDYDDYDDYYGGYGYPGYYGGGIWFGSGFGGRDFDRGERHEHWGGGHWGGHEGHWSGHHH